MNLVKWFRKNNTKIMAVVVIVLMIGFIGGSALTHFLGASRAPQRTLAHYGRHKITYYDRDFARAELDILQRLGAPQILQNQDLAGILMDELLFPNDRSSTSLITAAKQAIQRYGYRVSDKQLADMHRPSSMPAEIYWILLREEAKGAGIHIRNEEVGQILGKIIPQLFNGAGYAPVMQSLINQYRIPEEQILSTFGSLLAVLQYADFICDQENITNSEIRHAAAWQGQSLDATLVQLKAADFADKKMIPSDANMVAQFEKYKGFLKGAISDANPYGFGYKLPARVQSEYIALKMEDVQAIVKPPTQEEAEAYYQQNRKEQFTRQVRSDPNDPNSPLVTQVKSYSEVADSIIKQLTRERIITKAEQILLDARNQAEAGQEALAAGGKEPTVEELKAKVGDYEKIAQDLARKNDIALYSGRTGLLTASDIQEDKYLSRLRLTGYGHNPIPLSQILFSVRELGDRATTLLFVPNAKMYTTIGPLRDPTVATAPSLSNQVMAIVRIVAAEKAAEPADLEVAYSTKTLSLGAASKEDANDVFSVKKQVLEDLRILAAWETTKERAQEIVALASKDGWEKAVTEFNTLYGQQLKADPNDPNLFETSQRNGLQYISDAEVETITAQLANNANAPSLMNQLVMEMEFTDRLYSLVPADANAAPNMPTVMEYKPDQSVYALKTVVVRRLDEQQFENMKGMLLYRTQHIDAQSLAMVHFDPKNIVKRMEFNYAPGILTKQEDSNDVNSEDDAS
jgi:hypothetical protein